ncbi:DNA-binding protein [Salinibacterium sp. dk2585]|uniref:MGMT family protein n=1 Tax=unclassified Salinibacterium TaxID=2632331 RepID=UPI0011C24D9B|nr:MULTISPECIES: MGMT family protein [unclassified Salinibacterium]QEE62266.1 DNA-binding protein [Salinibacterium sp. dk2585]TXK53618.1 DNA-binding protein [Salinibacterium sp. dk5596]
MPESAPHPDDEFATHVLGIVAAIPPGRVMTYGDVASVLASRGARVVGNILATSGSDLPWWRVIRAGGLAPMGKEDRALEHYREEGTPLRWLADGTFRVDLGAARHAP